MEMVPTKEQCIQMLSDCNVPGRVRRHSRLVAGIAVCLAKLLIRSGYHLNLRVIEAAALLHDIARTRSSHAQAGADILLSKGYAGLAEIVRQHMKPDPEECGRISETTVVYLADKFVDGDRVVTLDQRFLKKRDAFRDDPAALRSIEENYRIAQKLQRIVENAIGCHGDIFELLR